MINELGGRVSVLVVENGECAASWFGANGMTSGKEQLAITPFKDVGFPYESHRTFGEWGSSIDAALVDFSWQRYLITKRQYGKWLNAGSPRVQHADYGRYLRWALARATNGVEILQGRLKCVSIERCRRAWRADIETPAGDIQRCGRSLVLTGAGTHRMLSHDSRAASRILHCDSPRSDFAKIPSGQGCDIAVIGGGDSALSAVLYTRALRPEAKLTIYTPQPPMSRGESFVENRVFADPDSVTWSSLDLQTRREFIRRTDKGVFGADDLAQLADDGACAFVVGRVVSISSIGDGLSLRYRVAGGVTSTRYDYAINCTGFDLLRQVKSLFSDQAHAAIEAGVGSPWSIPSDSEIRFGRMLEVEGLRPLLHIPGLAALSQGPGFANLGCLGLLANRILRAYVHDRVTMHEGVAA